MNCGVTTDNHFVADTNDSTAWDTLQFPLPEIDGHWVLACYEENDSFEVQGKVVVLRYKPQTYTVNN